MSKTTVMLIEDDIRASYTLELTINQHPSFEVIATSEGYADALVQFEAYKPMLVFVDITLPDGNGIDIIRKLHEKHATCDFIMTTAERETATVEKAIQLGVMDYLVKPIRMSRVIQALNDYKLYKENLSQSSVVDQMDIDNILKKTPTKMMRQTPKGIDSSTLSSLKNILQSDDTGEFSAEEIGKRMNVSRVTARRYLEFMESEGLVELVLNYNTGGRPRRNYRFIKKV